MGGMAAGDRIRVLGVAGSLRRGSYNRRLLEAAREQAPASLRIHPFPLNEIPPYNGDIDNDADRPEPVVRFKTLLAGADALLVATPEYNHSVPGVLQNAIDWASRPSMKSPLAGLPTAIIGAAKGAIGSARAQQQLKLTLFSTLALVMPHPGVVVGQAAGKFDDAGKLTDEPTRRFLRSFLAEFEAWARRVGPRVRTTD